ncbi:hypothetical protein GWG83_002535 [Enterococcus faecalis]|nr:hypothetical protein [Enterococcus faecalis]
MKEVDSFALANAQLNLNKAYKNFFRDKSVGFPRFKSKKNPVQSYTTNNQNGTVALIENNQFTSKMEKKLKREQRKLLRRALIAKKNGVTLFEQAYIFKKYVDISCVAAYLKIEIL